MNVLSKEKLPQYSYHHPSPTAIKSRTITNRVLPSIILFSVLLSLPIFLFFHYTWNHSSSIHPSTSHPSFAHTPASSSSSENFRHPHDHTSAEEHELPKLGDMIPSKDTLKGGTIMPKMANATAKAELGRATWKFMHTMTARFPEKPTADEREALKAFIYLFSRLYPCGDCARHFQELLKQYPPQTSSRNVASLHLCSLHNLVNERLGKPEYNCTSLLENYDCGCGHDEKEALKKLKKPNESFLDNLSLMTPAF
ncbi:hypothetical protein PGT21_011713 [Puccinia graminis f. sp. tritici]|uniref:Sulfhydryl oxidase n=1 Tax=Puccinia graminis f. sp. tritici TaxID=56615 RepID=A0A5B0QMZ8_PUCGR|nr:hypothetical protein PGT21_011713 [Puccinia graminis f. sp. tritici]